MSPRVLIVEMECGVCGCPLDSAEMPIYLYSCGDMVCYPHVLSPYCFRHADALLIEEMSTNTGFKRLREIKDWLEGQNSGGNLSCAIAGIKTDMASYLALVARQGGLGSVTSTAPSSAAQVSTYWLCVHCSSQNREESGNCWQCQAYRSQQGQIWACPWCHRSHYAEEATCQCGYPTAQSRDTAPIPDLPPTAVVTIESAVQVQSQAISIETMTDSHCDLCKSPISGQFLCAQCLLPKCTHCAQPVEHTEVMCEGCRDRWKPISCEDCGEMIAQKYCGDCLKRQRPKMLDKDAETAAVLCVKCKISPGNEAICQRCMEPEPLTCSICRKTTPKDLLSCENCQKPAPLTCNRCQLPLLSSPILCPKSPSSKIHSVDLKRPEEPRKPVKALGSPLAEEIKLPTYTVDQGTPQKTGPQISVPGYRALKTGISPAGSYQSKATRATSALPAGGDRGKLQLKAMQPAVSASSKDYSDQFSSKLAKPSPKMPVKAVLKARPQPAAKKAGMK